MWIERIIVAKRVTLSVFGSIQRAEEGALRTNRHLELGEVAVPTNALVAEGARAPPAQGRPGRRTPSALSLAGLLGHVLLGKGQLEELLLGVGVVRADLGVDAMFCFGQTLIHRLNENGLHVRKLR